MLALSWRADTVNFPVHIKNFNVPQLRQLCKELRSDIVHTVSKTGGHLSSSLGVVELTVALHYVFNAPEDKIIWDVGHQAYVHKILTGRRSQMNSIRTTGGLSGRCMTRPDSSAASHTPPSKQLLQPSKSSTRIIYTKLHTDTPGPTEPSLV